MLISAQAVGVGMRRPAVTEATLKAAQVVGAASETVVGVVTDLSAWTTP